MSGLLLLTPGDAFPAAEVAVDVVDRDDRLQQDVLAEDAVFGVGIVEVSRTAVMPIDRKRDVLAEVQLDRLNDVLTRTLPRWKSLYAAVPFWSK